MSATGSEPIGLLDCNNFYASAERVFNPAWAERPVVVLSNNDGCIIARSAEVKALGVKQAIAWHVTRAAVKLRRQQSLCGAMQVFLQTNPFQPRTPQYRNAALVEFSVPTADTRALIGAALRTLATLYRDGYAYKKCGVMLLDLSPAGDRQAGLFKATDTLRSEQLMQTVDRINQRFGRGTLRFAAEGFDQPRAMRCSRRTPAYTTRWSELVEVV